MTKKYRGYVVAKKGPKGRQAMRSTGRTYSTRKAAIDDMKGDNERWMAMNYGPEFGANKNYEYGAVESGKFPKDQTHKMDMKNMTYFDAHRGFMDALEVIGFYEIN